MRFQEAGGETGWVERVRTTHAGAAGDRLVVALGDDGAVFEVGQDKQVVVTTDMLIEGVHFRREWSDPYSIGWKAAAANLSDVAAMGGTPTFSVVAIAVTENDSVETTERMYDGFKDCQNRYDSRLIGGDTNRSQEQLIISVTQLAEVTAGRAMQRKGARPGDILLVTGDLGASATGLALLSEHGLARAEKVSKDLLRCHRRPQPRVVCGRAVAETGKVHAAMDISDGLVGDLKKLCAASNTGARIDTAALPISDDVRITAQMLGKDPIALALEGGEDYELLLAVAPKDVEEVMAAAQAVGTPITAIGEIVKAGFRIVAPNGEDDLPSEQAGWDHFSE
jgi:thiamine-monophosphate kinase